MKQWKRGQHEKNEKSKGKTEEAILEGSYETRYTGGIHRLDSEGALRRNGKVKKATQEDLLENLPEVRLDRRVHQVEANQLNKTMKADNESAFLPKKA
jgi:hypothetical protein